MSVISEEDMLAGALLWWLDEDPESEPVPCFLLPPLVAEALDARWDDLGSPEDLAIPVADCERRWEVERAERKVLEVARRWARGAATGWELALAVRRMNEASAP